MRARQEAGVQDRRAWLENASGDLGWEEFLLTLRLLGLAPVSGDGQRLRGNNGAGSPGDRGGLQPALARPVEDRNRIGTRKFRRTR